MNGIPGRRVILALTLFTIAAACLLFVWIRAENRKVTARAQREDEWPLQKETRAGMLAQVKRGAFTSRWQNTKAILPGFFINRQPVSRDAYAAYCRDTARCVVTPGPGPATSVSLAGARAFCEWAGLRLPFSAEWDKASQVVGTGDSGMWEWVEERRSPGEDALADAAAMVQPPATRFEPWGAVWKGKFNRTVPARAAAADITFRCVELPR